MNLGSSPVLASGSGLLGSWRSIAPLVAVYVLTMLGAALGLHGIVREVDRSDAVRATEAVNAAFNYQFSRLEMVTLNNAVYTEAWKAVGSDTVNKAWAIENWTVAPPDLPGHHGILLVEADGSPIVGTRAGRPMSDSAMAEMAALVRPVVNDAASKGSASGRALINTGPVTIMVAVATVMPEPADRAATDLAGPSRRLVLMHPMNDKLLATMNETIGGEQLRLGGGGRNDSTATFPARAGGPIKLAWRSRQPGQAAMMRSLETIVPVLLLVTLFSVIAVKSSLATSKALKRAARIDSLTQLPNRVAFSEQLQAKVKSSQPYFVGLIDLDGFKQVNDIHGHFVGDDLLRAVGKLLGNLFDGVNTIARLGGDEFAFITSDRRSAEGLILRLQLELTKPFKIGAVMLTVGASVGLSQGTPGQSAEEVLNHADAELYADKREKHSSHCGMPTMRARQQSG
jgi:diguanylate cyclase (GGDEF)-like protein